MKKSIKLIISILGGMWFTGLFYSFLYFCMTAQILYFLIFLAPTLIGLIGSVIYSVLK